MKIRQGWARDGPQSEQRKALKLALTNPGNYNYCKKHKSSKISFTDCIGYFFYKQTYQHSLALMGVRSLCVSVDSPFVSLENHNVDI